MTQVTPTCSMGADGGFPAQSDGVRGSVWRRGGVPGLPVPTAMARRLSLPPLWAGQSLASPGGLFECAHCAAQVSVTAGTIFQDTRQPLRLWFRAMWWVSTQKNGASALSLQRILGLGSYKTAWTWLHKLRRAMVRPGRDRLRGWVGGRKGFGVDRPRQRLWQQWLASKMARASGEFDSGG